MKTETLMWLLPVVFMIHDFEEIILVELWMKRNAGYLQQRFPWLAARLLPHFQGLSTASFALAVAVEFVLLSAVTLLAVELELYALWAGVLLGFFIHLVVHIGQFLVLRRYVPSLLTSLLASAYCLAALVMLQARGVLDWSAALPWAGTALVVIAVNLVVVHRLAGRFEKYLRRI